MVSIVMREMMWMGETSTDFSRKCTQFIPFQSTTIGKIQIKRANEDEEDEKKSEQVQKIVARPGRPHLPSRVSRVISDGVRQFTISLGAFQWCITKGTR
jgi:hypothetical protein